MAGTLDVVIHRVGATGAMGVMGVAGIERNRNGLRVEAIGQVAADVGIDILDVLDHHGHADIFRALHRLAQGIVKPFHDAIARTVDIVEVVVAPGRVRAMDDHLRGADRLTDRQ